MRTYLNGDWLEGTTVLKEKAIETDITTRSQINATTWITTQDRVFLLSEADLFGTINNVATANEQDYTYGNSVIVPDVNMRKFTGSAYAWLRSPRYSTSCEALVNSNGSVYNTSNGVNGTYGVRPALWVSLAP